MYLFIAAWWWASFIIQLRLTRLLGAYTYACNKISNHSVIQQTVMCLADADIMWGSIALLFVEIRRCSIIVNISHCSFYVE